MACKVSRLTLDDADTQVLDRWMRDGRDVRDRRVSAERMHEALLMEGHNVSPTTLKDHRAGRCACWRG